MDDTDELGEPTGFVDFDGELMPYWLPDNEGNKPCED